MLCVPRTPCAAGPMRVLGGTGEGGINDDRAITKQRRILIPRERGFVAKVLHKYPERVHIGE